MSNQINPSVAVMSVLISIHQVKDNGFSKMFDTFRLCSIIRSHGFNMTNDHITETLHALAKKGYVKIYVAPSNKSYFCSTEKGRTAFASYQEKGVC
ncbi:hypothetical protein [Dehalobacter sp. 14DCB1]|uniref:hypothetical protein n=1 Tax=Dehalobacter sp. 14DCB1 TaxID=2070227 RepID=UPI001046E0C8|nr:hypothetical protein [Dehalobacter sp. 14DCB1]TCX53843.1 hypothetical protein C1I36_03675 [Dehalobacter sp. 14DCB1]